MSNDLDRALNRLADRPDENTMAAIAATAPEAEISQLARLTQTLADSGECLGPPTPDVVDIASSGGPGSLSTLLAPLFARTHGVRVAKIAVPGRPAGGLDVLASLPGYDPDLDPRAARRVLDDCGYVHVAAGAVFCPLDARFFTWRQANGAQAVPNLAITSLLAKKLAAGVGRVVLDIRVGSHGNFGATPAEARPNAQRFVAVAAELGIQAVCVLTSSSGAAQPWIGRGEAVVALARVLTDTADGSLRAHADECIRMASLAADASAGASAPAATACQAHEMMLAAHGSAPKTFWSRQREIATARTQPVVAERTGFVELDLGGIRRILVDRQKVAKPPAGARFADPAGVRLEVPDRAAVRRGAIIAQVRDDDDAVHLANQISEHLRVVAKPPLDVTKPAMEIIGG